MSFGFVVEDGFGVGEGLGDRLGAGEEVLLVGAFDIEAGVETFRTLC